MRILIALGGNALIRESQRGTWAEQQENALGCARAVARLCCAGHEVVLGHGNGPQVGVLALQQACAEPEAPALPFDALVAMTQGQMGYLLQEALATVDPDLPTAVILTRAIVDEDDPAFDAAPTKPIGRFYDEAQARRVAGERGWAVGPDAGRGWRRMIASPRPLEVVEHEQIALLSSRGVVVIAAGGGGIPVVRRQGRLAGIEAVIDKDRCAAELGIQVGADLLILTTSVARVSFDFGTRWQRDMARLTVSDAMRHLRAGDFPVGSMGPKIDSAIRFVSNSGRAVITDPGHLGNVLDGDQGTWIVPDEEGPSHAAPAPAAA
ncbi:MAG: carbamate kinase [Actinomycetota bacterium]|nr:carbamate kinase [Actinomycetota bacterium]